MHGAMSERHRDELDGWRGLAIVFLLVGHFLPVPGINLGTVGVDLFFVLSGLLMARLLFIDTTPIGVFYRRRTSRIFPAHFFFLLAVVCFFLVGGRAVNWREIAAAAGFVNNYATGDLGRATMPFGHIWSLSVEEHAYILLSLAAIAARRGWVPARWSIGTLALLFSFAGWAYWSRYSGRELDFDKWLHTEVSAYGIVASAWLALWFHARGTPRLPLWAWAALLLGGMALHWWSVPNPIRTSFGVGLFALSVNLLAQAPSRLKRWLSFAPLRMLGLWSFSIYLWQQPFYLALHRGQLGTASAMGLALLVGIVSFHALEQPIRRALNRHWAARRPHVPAASSEIALPRA